MRMRNVLCVMMAMMMAVSPLFALNGRDVIQKVNDVKDPEYTHTLDRMDLIDKDGSTQSRVLEEWGSSKDDVTNAVIVFRNPASVKNTRFLTISKKNGSSDKWIYLPSLRTTRRVASSEGDKSFMGSDVTYDDMTDRDIDDDDHILVGESTDKNGFTCYEVKSTPKDPSSSQYGYKVCYVDHETLLPVYTEMYDKEGVLLKVLTVEEIKKVSTYQTPVSTLLENVQSGHKTRLVITNIEVDKPVPDKVFTQNFLNTGKI